ncbi:MAG: RES family NAD+ phosphorylase [Rhodospirillaceae bacterium]|jgi:hypothetical protein|nr:RES family NAD+ phosphorylase [Rhodospirillaceae bacterium]
MAQSSRITWQYHRLINSAYPPIDLFEDIADPADWELLAAAESKTNPRVAETIGNLDAVPAEHRVSGAGASYVMAPFVHASLDKPGRFHDGTFGAFYGANQYETALFETLHHTGQFCAATNEVPGWIADMRELVGEINADLVDIRGNGFDALLASDDYAPSQAFARMIRDAGDNGIVYPSVRHEEGECFAAFRPDVMGVPIQGRHITYHWDGNRINMIQDVSDDNKVYEIEM